MGLLHTAVTIRNPADLARSWTGSFVVGTGAIDTFVPRPQLERSVSYRKVSGCTKPPTGAG